MKNMLVALLLLGSVLAGTAFAAPACCPSGSCCQDMEPCCQ